MVSQYRKNPLFCVIHGFCFWAPEVFWVHGLYGPSQPKRGYARSRTTEQLGMWEFFFFEMWRWKYVEIGQLFLCRRPIATILDPFLFGWEKCQPCIPGYLKRFKNGQNSLYAHLMHSIASHSPGLRYIIQHWGHWHHHNGFTISKKKPFFCGNRVFFWRHPRFSKSTA